MTSKFIRYTSGRDRELISFVLENLDRNPLTFDILSESGPLYMGLVHIPCRFDNILTTRHNNILYNRIYVYLI
jgi:hypothetical protein